MHGEALFASLVDTIDDFYRSHPELTYSQLLSAIERIRFQVTEEYLRTHPRIMWTGK